MGAAPETARTVAVNTLVAGEIAYLFCCRRTLDPSWTIDGLFGNRAVFIAIGLVVGLQGLFTYAPFMQALFKTAPLDAAAWTTVALFAATLFALVEIEKAVTLRVRKGKAL